MNYFKEWVYECRISSTPLHWGLFCKPAVYRERTVFLKSKYIFTFWVWSNPQIDIFDITATIHINTLDILFLRAYRPRTQSRQPKVIMSKL